MSVLLRVQFDWASRGWIGFLRIGHDLLGLRLPYLGMAWLFFTPGLFRIFWAQLAWAFQGSERMGFLGLG